MKIISIDPSLISTAVVIGDGDDFKMLNYCRESDVYTKKGLGKWFKSCEELIDYKFIQFRSFDNYSDGEIAKLRDYNKITESIVDDLVSLIGDDKEVFIGMEGIAFGASVGDLVDLVSFSTLLRAKLLSLTNNIKIVAPLTLKQEACKLTYLPENVGKKVEKLVWRNKQGIAGGHFTKREVFLSITENEVWKDKWSQHCKKMASEILTIKSIPKPYEDINDAFVLYKSVLSKNRS